MWYLELCEDSRDTYSTVFTGLFDSEEKANKKAKEYHYHLKILKYVKVYK